MCIQLTLTELQVLLLRRMDLWDRQAGLRTSRRKMNQFCLTMLLLDRLPQNTEPHLPR